MSPRGRHAPLLPRGITAPVLNLNDIPDELPRVLRELMAENELRLKKSPDVPYTWNGYNLALGDVWRVFKHLYNEG